MFVQDQQQGNEELLEELRAEVARLLLADEISEEEKLSRIKRAQEIFETKEFIR